MLGERKVQIDFIVLAFFCKEVKILDVTLLLHYISVTDNNNNMLIGMPLSKSQRILRLRFHVFLLH